MQHKDIVEYNKNAWDKQVDAGHSDWTKAVTREEIQKARNGQINIFLTPTKPIPKSWFPELKGCRTLCLASGGGQQSPILAAAGAKVTVFDNSPVSNVFVSEIVSVWKEAARVLKTDGLLLSGFTNPDAKAEAELYLKCGEALEFGHTLEDQLAGQLEAGFVIMATKAVKKNLN